MNTKTTTDTIMGRRVARVAAAEAELVGVTAERDALRAENEQLLNQAYGMDRNLDEAELLGEGRWFTAADAEPEDLPDSVVLCAPTRGLIFHQRSNGTWESPHLSHTGFDWSDMLERYGPLLVVPDPDDARRVIDELERRRSDERRVQRALWDADSALSREVDRHRSLHLEVPERLAELAASVKALAATGRIGGPRVDWAENTAKAIGQVTAVLVRVLDEQRVASRAGGDR